MNENQKIVLIVYAIVVFVICVVPPWAGYRSGGKISIGSSPIWAISASKGVSIDISLLLTELFAVTVIATVAFVLFKRK